MSTDHEQLDLRDITHPSVRAVHRAVRVPGAKAPYDTAHLRLFYPAAFAGDAHERNTGEIRCADEGAPFGVVILLGGVNLPPEGYGWLGRRLAAAGFVTVTVGHVADIMGSMGLSPGMDLDAVRPDRYGRAPSATLVQPILDDLVEVNAKGLLEGKLDLGRIALGGHSAGGTMALLNAGMFESVKAVFTYGAHAGVSTVLGYPAGTVLRVHSNHAVLVAGGTADGVIEASSGRYGAEPSADAPLRRTFREALPEGRGTSHLVLVEGGNHFSLVHPLDPTSGRAFLEAQPYSTPELREYLGDLFCAFVSKYLGNESSASAFETLIADQHPLVAHTETK